MKIVILSQYYPPEVGAPQNRLSELAVRLKSLGADVRVITAMPNYPHMKIAEGYHGKWRVEEQIDGVPVTRCWIYVPQSKSIVPRLLNYFSFVFSAFWIGCFRMKRSDFLICESPPLFLGITAYLLSRLKRTPMIFNVSDLWPESAEKLGLVRNKLLLRMSTALEEFLYRKSILIMGQTQGIVQNIKSRLPRKEVYWLPNGVDISLYDPKQITAQERVVHGLKNTDKVFFYGGIIGHAQGLDVILKAARLLQHHSDIKFVLLGEGPEKERLQQLRTEWTLDNVIFIDAIPKTLMPSFVAMIDCAILPLRKLDLFKGAIPSKVFENLAMEKPVLLGIDGEAKTLFIDEAKAGLYFEPENEQALADAVLFMSQNADESMKLGKRGREYVSEKFERNKIALALYRKLDDIDKNQTR